MDVRHIFKIEIVTDTIIVLGDTDFGPSITNAARHVIDNLAQDLNGGIGKRKVYYRDTTGRFDELHHENSQFTKFSPCTEQQQIFLDQFISPKRVRDWGAKIPFD